MALIVLLSYADNPFIKFLKPSAFLFFNYLGRLLEVSFAGVVAVVAFFIISGFVIHYPNKDKIPDLKFFFIRRYLRILIPLIVVKVIGIPFGSPENVVVWSLYCELVYYTIYPLLVAVNLSLKIKTAIAFLLAAIVIIAEAPNDLKSLLTHSNIHYNGNFWQLGSAFTWLIGLPFWLLGVVLAQQIDGLNKVVTFRQLIFFRLLNLLLASSILVLRFHFFVSYLFTLFIISLPLYKWIETEICYYKNHVANKLLERLGKFSYSLYLCHPLLLFLLALYLPLNKFTYFIYLIFTIAGAYTFYLLLERPAHLLAQKIALSIKKTRVNV